MQLEILLPIIHYIPHISLLIFSVVIKSLTNMQLSVLSVVFLTGLGMIMYNSGVNYRFLDSLGLTDSIPDSSKLEFAGSIIATASWVSVDVHPWSEFCANHYIIM